MADTRKTGAKSPRPARKKKEPASAGKSKHFPVVAIGASAGGLEALEAFLRSVPARSGVAFVVIQHLDPTHKGMLTEILQRSSRLPIYEIKDRMKVEPDTVYVIPPNANLGILRGRLQITKPLAPRGLRLPIDSFFTSMAEELKELAIGVVLSGMGSDGTAGLHAIKERAGLGLAQDPSSAKFDGMPRSAIDAGLADIVAAPGELPGKILAYLHHAPLLASSKSAPDARSLGSLDKIVLLLRGRTGNDFSLYKKNTLYRRVERRMGIHQLARIADYVGYLQENQAEQDLLFKELLIGVTNFFRDRVAWEQLKSGVLPSLMAKKPDGSQLRAWVAGCSTGEEAYSLAMTFLEALEETPKHRGLTLQIFATDMDKEAVEKGRQGFYPATIEADVSSGRLNRFFTKEGSGYRVGKAIREMVIFAPHNIIRDPPFTKLDLLSCRNLLIYLEPELQKELFFLFHYSLNPGGVLFLGSAESLGSFDEYFETLQSKEKLFSKREGTADFRHLPLPSAFSKILTGDHMAIEAGKTERNLEELTDKLVIRHHSPAAVLVTEEGDILYATARTGKYLEPPVGKANLNLFAMAREGLRQELSLAFQKLKRESGTLTLRGLTVGTNGGKQQIDLTLQALLEPPALKGKYLLVFRDVPSPLPAKAPAKGRSGKQAPVDDKVAELTRDLLLAKQELQTTREEMQSSQEELKSSNEELQSTNEELQSTNEELTTSREEMQSMNEELQSLNAELSSKLEELSRSSADMKNLLNSTDIATVFLDGQLRVRRFTERATSIVKLIPGDVGRPFADLTSALVYPELLDDAREVLRTLVFCDKEAATNDGHWYQVRILPYRTLEDRIDGVVITFSDITSSKNLEKRLRSSRGVKGGAT